MGKKHKHPGGKIRSYSDVTFYRISGVTLRRIMNLLRSAREISVFMPTRRLRRTAILAEDLIRDIDGRLDEVEYRDPVGAVPTVPVGWAVVLRVPYRNRYADDAPRLPIYRSPREAALAMIRNGWSQEDGYTIIRVNITEIRGGKKIDINEIANEEDQGSVDKKY